MVTDKENLFQCAQGFLEAKNLTSCGTLLMMIIREIKHPTQKDAKRWLDLNDKYNKECEKRK